jgi:hypothetical protein
MAGARTPADLLDEVKSEFKGKRAPLKNRPLDAALSLPYA